MSGYVNDNKVHRLVVCISKPMKERVKRNAANNGISASQYVRMCIDYYEETRDAQGEER